MVVNLQFFGGRGSTSGLALTEKQAKKIEDSAQMKDTMLNGARLGAKFYEYTDSNGKNILEKQAPEHREERTEANTAMKLQDMPKGVHEVLKTSCSN